MSFTPEQRKEISEALTARSAVLPCPRCTNTQFGLIDGFFNQVLQPQLGGIMLGGPSVPSVVVYCTRCGFLAQHSVGMLNLSWLKEQFSEVTEDAKK